MKNTKNYAALAAGVLATAGLGSTVQAQTADALLDKLVEKGVLTAKEATDMRAQASDSFDQAYRAKTGMPEWVNSLKFNGDFRGRFEQGNADNPAYITRNRERFRLRIGAVASLQDDFEIGFRLASGNPQTNPAGALVGGQSITANQDLNSLDTRKFIWIDAAYAKWTPIHTDDWTVSATIGKMNNPFELSNMLWDYDIAPEGAAFQVKYNLNGQHALKVNSGIFVLDNYNQDQTAGAPALNVGGDINPYVYGSQFLFESKWMPTLETSFGISLFDIANRQGLSNKLSPSYNFGNYRDANGFLLYNMNPVIGTASVTYKVEGVPLYEGAFPIKPMMEYLVNPGAASNNRAYRVGILVGKAGKKGLWEINYRYQRLEANAWFDALEDDDNGAFFAPGNTIAGKTVWAGGTNVKGHLIQPTYSLTDSLNLALTFYINDLIVKTPGQSSAAEHFMIDLNWKF